MCTFNLDHERDFMAVATGKTHYSESVIDKVLVKTIHERLGGSPTPSTFRQQGNSFNHLLEQCEKGVN